MKNLVILLFGTLFLVSCADRPSLQKYFVKNTESSAFIAVDLPPSLIKTDKFVLSEAEKEALKSFDKMNILAFKSDSSNAVAYDKEILEVKTILKDESYQQLMKVGSGSDGASIYFVGADDEHIEEFVILAGKKENGFAVIRVLGTNMNPTHVFNMIAILQKSDVNLEQLKPLQALVK
ncbi:DUF4252 domain-containing protein [Flavobacterium ardleyense]|uniref:DUF4252 domain-containing protein n=1 Tax=Flavobacterium ardleyense TaxID=2038737 RepID=A0ABW5ZB09_9FLAO